LASLRKRRNSRGRLWFVLAITVIVAGALVVVGLYGGSLGLGGLSHLGSAPAKDTITLSNVTMTAFPGIESGTIGLGIQATILNNAAVKIQNTTMFVDTLSLGSCATNTIKANQQVLCKTGETVNCSDMPGAAPYTIKAQVEYADGTTYNATLQIASQLTTTC